MNFISDNFHFHVVIVFLTDNVTLGLDGVLYTKVFDPYKVSF